MDPPGTAHPARHDTRRVPVPGTQRWATAVSSANDVLTMPGHYRSSSLSYTIHRSSQLACSALLTGPVPRYKLRRQSVPPLHEQQVPRVTVTVMAQASYLLLPISWLQVRDATEKEELGVVGRSSLSSCDRHRLTCLRGPGHCYIPLLADWHGPSTTKSVKFASIRPPSSTSIMAWLERGLDSGLWAPEEPQRSASVPVHREATGIHCPQCQ